MLPPLGQSSSPSHTIQTKPLKLSGFFVRSTLLRE
jgi:hypothetical protein